MRNVGGGKKLLNPGEKTVQIEIGSISSTYLGKEKYKVFSEEF